MQQHRFDSMTRCVLAALQLSTAARRKLNMFLSRAWLVSHVGSTTLALVCHWVAHCVVQPAMPYGLHVLRTLRNSYPQAAAGRLTPGELPVRDRARVHCLSLSRGTLRRALPWRVFTSSAAPIRSTIQFELSSAAKQALTMAFCRSP